MTLQKTEKVKLDLDLIPNPLYMDIVKEFCKTRKGVVYVNEIEVTAILEYEED